MITISDLSLRFRGPSLLDQVSCQIEAGQRIGLLGRNGSGKTTLMGILCGAVEPDSGTTTMAPQTRLSMLPQDVPDEIFGAIFDVVREGFPREDVAVDDAEHDWAWRADHATDQILSRMQLEPTTAFESLSSGMKRRVLLARCLVSSPDVLLLDEPTNHLDLDAITWLEQFLDRWQGTLIFVTHDRTFLRRLATRILEIDRGRLFDWSCDYDTFLKRKEAALEAEEKQNALFDKRLAEEEAWIRQGIKARRTRNEGRVRSLQKMRTERRDRRDRVGRVQLRIQAAERSGMLVADLQKVSFAFDDRPLIEDFTTTVMRGDKVGIIGPNGSGKTTLLKLLLGKLSPQQGKIRLGTNLKIAYFDQLRHQLDEDKTVQENVGDGYETVQVGGGSKHVLGYLQDFLFTPERARTPVRFLSGGERNRILLAKLFAKPANVIVLDEPTNDLDAETLELLEDRLVAFNGTVLLVSHDRAFLNNVVTSTIAFDKGLLEEFVGGYDDWQRQVQARHTDAPSAPAVTKPKRQAKENKATASDQPRKRTYREQQELA
ncbi:MAG: ABC transporter ATP-binding protein, partial [Planctomycetaceae bacterium]|nr:ABC transporter ATP-binding protein [Planctomycetaceae bacterium]